MRTLLRIISSLLILIFCLPSQSKAITHDAGISSLVHPLPGGVFGTETITCLFYNYSTDYFTGTAIASFSVDGGPIYTETITDVVLPPANYITFDQAMVNSCAGCRSQ
jgi:hypothetical protein